MIKKGLVVLTEGFILVTSVSYDSLYRRSCFWEIVLSLDKCFKKSENFKVNFVLQIYRQH